MPSSSSLAMRSSYISSHAASAFILLALLLLAQYPATVVAHLDQEAARLLSSFEPFYMRAKAQSAEEEWNYQTNMTQANLEALVSSILRTN